MIEIVTIALLVIFAVVWLWGMWIAFTQGNDVIARFGQSVLRLLRR